MHFEYVYFFSFFKQSLFSPAAVVGVQSLYRNILVTQEYVYSMIPYICYSPHEGTSRRVCIYDKNNFIYIYKNVSPKPMQKINIENIDKKNISIEKVYVENIYTRARADTNFPQLKLIENICTK